MHRFLTEMYRVARSAEHEDFKSWALRQSCDLEGLHSASWVHGVMRDGVPVFHDSCTAGLKPGYWSQMQALAAEDPLGPRMFASPGTSFVTTYADFPPAIVDRVMKAYDVSSAISGMTCSPDTGLFSVVCWHRDPSRPALTHEQRRLHEQLLPHWLECLTMNRVNVALRDLQTVARPGYVTALVDGNGLLHYSQRDFGRIVQIEFPDWNGSVIPAALASLISDSSGNYQGTKIVADWQSTTTGLILFHIREINASDRLTTRERQVAQMLAGGDSVKEVARALKISPATVDNVRTAIYAKLGIGNRAQLAQKMGSFR